MYILIVVIPLISAMIAGLLGRRIGSKGAGIITTGSIVISALLA
jgi:NADH:ubiquinone oxidoreductase subunit 5 (subunit L)/multisubunit Na+/H+ antiporter MnhA subunit